MSPEIVAVSHQRCINSLLKHRASGLRVFYFFILVLSFPISLTNKERDALLVKTLLMFGADMNQQGLNDFTPLDLAIHNQCSEVERVLLEHGAKGSVNLIVQKRTFSKVSIMIIIVLAIIIFKRPSLVM